LPTAGNINAIIDHRHHRIIGLPDIVGLGRPGFSRDSSLRSHRGRAGGRARVRHTDRAGARLHGVAS
jgi:hypothetical protein